MPNFKEQINFMTRHELRKTVKNGNDQSQVTCFSLVITSFAINGLQICIGLYCFRIRELVSAKGANDQQMMTTNDVINLVTTSARTLPTRHRFFMPIPYQL